MTNQALRELLRVNFAFAILLGLIFCVASPGLTVYAKRKPAKYGVIKIQTSPGGLPIEVDGKPEGATTTDWRSWNKEPGLHTVVISLPDGQKWIREFTLDAGRIKCVTLNLGHDIRRLQSRKEWGERFDAAPPPRRPNRHDELHPDRLLDLRVRRPERALARQKVLVLHDGHRIGGIDDERHPLPARRRPQVWDDRRLLPEHGDRQTRQRVLKIFEPKTPNGPTHRDAPRDRARPGAASLSQSRVPAQIMIGR
jgi:hypothetical protein